MCLFSKEEVPRIAQEDIECFKILQQKDGQWITPYRDYPVEFNKVLEAINNNEFSKTHKYPTYIDYYAISEGYFHVCDSEKSTRKHAEEIKIAYTRNKHKCPPLTGFKAIIPKGSEYYIGVHGDLCSDKLIILKE